MLNPKNFYLPKKEAIITEKRFRDLFFVNRADSFRLTAVLSNIAQVEWDKGKYAASRHGLTSFYKQGIEHNEKVMKLVFRTQNYNELVDYLFSIGEEWRFEQWQK